MKRVKICLLTLLAVSLSLGATPQAARADSSCTALLTNKKLQASPNQTYAIEMTMHREDVSFVSYSSGYLTPNSDGSFGGRSNQLFSDRTAGQQPFNINSADQLYLKLSPTGLLTIHYEPWNFDTTWDMSCKGSMLTTYIPNVGVVTLTFRNASIIIGERLK